MHKVTSRWGHQNSLKIEWNLGKRCNYDCAYCPSIIHDNHSEHTDFKILQQAVDFLSELDKPVRISFTGGEPCVHPEFHTLVKYAKYKGIHWLSVTTNGTRHSDYYKSLPVDQIIFSIHFQYDWKRVLNTVLDTANNDKNTQKTVIGQIMAHHDYMPAVKQVRDMLNHDGVANNVRRIRWTEGDHDLFDDLRYHPDDLNWIKDQESTVMGNCLIDDHKIMHSNDVIKLHLNQYKTWQCHAGLESLMINWDGEVHRATCRVGGSLGNIYQGTFEAPVTTIECTRNYCTCAADIPITKYDKNHSN